MGEVKVFKRSEPVTQLETSAFLWRTVPASSRLIRGEVGPLALVLREEGLYPVFQPIVNLEDASIYAHEALIRGPVFH